MLKNRPSIFYCRSPSFPRYEWLRVLKAGVVGPKSRPKKAIKTTIKTAIYIYRKYWYQTLKPIIHFCAALWVHEGDARSFAFLRGRYGLLKWCIGHRSHSSTQVLQLQKNPWNNIEVFLSQEGYWGTCASIREPGSNYAPTRSPWWPKAIQQGGQKKSVHQNNKTRSPLWEFIIVISCHNCVTSKGPVRGEKYAASGRWWYPPSDHSFYLHIHGNQISCVWNLSHSYHPRNGSPLIL